MFIMCALVLIWIISHHIMTSYEQNKYPPLGEMVEVDGKKIHVYTEGNGEHTIVLLSGLGTTSPMLDYEPLIDELAKQHKVVIVEPFGYGWSELTSKTRSVENIVEEIRLALHKANVDGPFVLMPHSLSGIYSLYFANRFPNEVDAVIGIDMTLPYAVEYFGESVPKTPNYMKLIPSTGIARIATYMSPGNILPVANEGTYTKENLKMTKAITAWKGYNRNVIDETNEIGKNIEKTKELSFPDSMPVLFFTSNDQRTNTTGKTNVTFLQTQLTESPSSDIVILDGHHYLHWTKSKEISDQVNLFIKSYSE